MTDKPYSLIDAIQEEVDLLEELQKYHKQNDFKILAAMFREQKSSLERIVDRYNNGKEYLLTVKNGKTVLDTRQTTRHLEREYPSVAKAKQNLNTVVGLTGG
jgi:hypothetical protein